MQPPAATPPPPPASPAARRPHVAPKLVLLTLILLVIAFAAGFVPQKLRADRLEETLRATELDLALADLHRDLGVAALEAQRSNFASAANAAGAFFEGCARIAQSQSFKDEPRTGVALGGYAAQRDSVMVQLASADPTVVHRLASLYFTMEGVLERRKP